MGLRLRIVLPFGRAEFRATSVADRPGKWGTLHDELLDEVEKNRDLVVIRTDSDAKAFAEANRAIEGVFRGQHVAEYRPSRNICTAVSNWRCPRLPKLVEGTVSFRRAHNGSARAVPTLAAAARLVSGFPNCFREINSYASRLWYINKRLPYGERNGYPAEKQIRNDARRGLRLDATLATKSYGLCRTHCEVPEFDVSLLLK
jgi:hypothetical protein